ncbi:MAG: MATE family efflux transporter [Butyrivibrio sp.]|uniref:MATE family efflux transporter n=1 Tax=Butyrivibrio sp. TaxID=28121 RepID=UPI0025CB7CA5|nr:MATE family efflux transporter [Butyrivibrio sp.]MCR5771303.1 MATE family efflux transporter [Butyrivibrio sp.]
MNKIKDNAITEGVIWKEMLRYFFPLLFGTFFQQLYNTVDAIIVGRFVGSGALAAVGGSAAMIVNLFVGFFTGLASGATVIIAQYYGAKREDDVKKAVHNAVAVALVGGTIFMVLGIIFAPWGIKILNTPSDTVEMSVLYLRIYFVGMIPNLMYNMGAGILRAVGDSRRPLFVLILATFCNIILDVVLVLGLGLGVEGVAIATIICQTISGLFIFYILTHLDAAYKLIPSRISFDKGILVKTLHIGLPAGFQSMMYTLSNLIIQAAINSFGKEAVSAWAAYGKIDVLLWMITGSLGISVTTFVGQNYGAGKYDRVHQTVRDGFVITSLFCVALSVLMYTFRMPLLSLFTTDEGVLAFGDVMMCAMVPYYILYVSIEMCSGALRGMGEAIIPTLLTLTGVCLLRVVWIFYALPIRNQITTVVYSYPITWAVTSVLFLVYYFFASRKKLKRAPKIS